MTSKEFNNGIRNNILGEFTDKDGNVEIIYIEYIDSENELIAGTLTNVGLIGITSIKYNDSLHIDSNIEILIDKLEELGYERIN